MNQQRLAIIFYFVIILISGIYGCSNNNERAYDKETTKIVEPIPEPLGHALRLIEIDLSNLGNSEYYEVDYNMICRMPIIDKIAQNPFSLPHWADAVSAKLTDKQNLSSTTVLRIMTETLKGSLSDRVVKKGQLNPMGLQSAYKKLCDVHGGNVDQKKIAMIKQAGFSEAFDSQVGQLVYRISEASLLAKKAFSRLSNDERKFLLARPEQFFYPKGLHFDFLTAPVYTQVKISFLTRKIDFNSLYESADMVTLAVEQFAEFLKSQKNLPDPSGYFKDGQIHKGVVLKLASPIGDIVILGEEDNLIHGNAAILIDLGGNDTYAGDIANGSLMPGRISVAIDIDGDDTYDNKMNTFSQGFGCMSIGFLMDVNGNDRYVSGNMAQGCGIYGVGILEDLAGDDTYLMGLLGQGFGAFGAGVLLDQNGDDRYMINGLGQGAGSTMGFGCLIDSNGNDKYIAESKKTRGKLIPDDLMNHVQGAGFSIRSPEWPKQFSLYGGIGFLNDGDGNDFYYSDGGNCMGSSYFMSLGVLVDHEGDDFYMPEKGYGIGSAVHLTSAIFIDRKGNDRYFALHHHSGGVGSDRSTGIMIDYEGNDIYGPTYDYLKDKIQQEMVNRKEKIPVSELKKRINDTLPDASFGAALKPDALGMLIDYKGNDQYFSKKDGYGESCGGVIPPIDPQTWSHALLMDLDGRDTYSKEGMKNNHYLRYFGHGLCYDINYNGDDILLSMGTPEKLLPEFKTGHVLREPQRNMEELLCPDVFKRYSAAGKIIEEGVDAVFEIINLLEESSDSDLNRDLIEILNIFIIKKQFKQKHIKYLEKLLKAKDPFVRGFTAHAFGAYKAKSAVHALVQSIDDENEKVRSHIIWALGQITSPLMYELLINSASHDPSLECRRTAVHALNNLVKNNELQSIEYKEEIFELLLKSAADKDEGLRVYAASGFCNYFNMPQAVMKLKGLLTDKSVYVRRTSATVLIESGYKEGIPVLLKTLQYPSIDTFEFYGHDLVMDIAFYCGVDFPKEKRYLYSTWMKWWSENGMKLNLENNLSIMRDIQNAFFVKQESSGVKVFRRLLKENPENIVIKNRFVQFCNEWIHYKLLSKENVTPAILETCIGLQKNIIEMEPEDSNHRVALANLYARLAKYDKAEEAMKYAVTMEPDNQNYLNTWNVYKQLAGE